MRELPEKGLQVELLLLIFLGKDGLARVLVDELVHAVLLLDLLEHGDAHRELQVVLDATRYDRVDPAEHEVEVDDSDRHDDDDDEALESGASECYLKLFSPKPTVIMVSIIQWIENKYFSKGVLSCRLRTTTQLLLGEKLKGTA